MLVSRGLCKGQLEPSGLSDPSLWFLFVAWIENPGNSALVILNGGDVLKFKIYAEENKISS